MHHFTPSLPSSVQSFLTGCGSCRPPTPWPAWLTCTPTPPSSASAATTSNSGEAAWGMLDLLGLAREGPLFRAGYQAE